MSKFTTFIKKPLNLVLIAAVLFAAWGVYFYFSGPKTSPYELVAVKKGEIIQKVSLTGRVKPADDVNLALEKSGKVAQVYVKVGDRVAIGQLLVALSNADLVAQLDQAKAGLLAQQAELDELKKGTRPEELQAAQTAVDNAQNSLIDAESNLTNVISKADADLRSVYDGSLSAAAKSVAVAVNSIYILTDIQFNYFVSNDTTSSALADAKSQAVLALLGDANSGRALNSSISLLNGGAKLSVQTAQASPTDANINRVLIDVKNALEKTKTALEAVPVTASLTSTERTNLNTEKSNVNAEITTIAAKQQAIDVQKATNNYNITAARTSLTTAQNTFNSAKDSLALKQAGSTPEAIKAQEAQVKSAKANVDNYQAQLAKTVITSPLNGVVTQQDAKVGEIAAANTSLVSILSTAQFEIEANVSENEIAKVNLGDIVEMTLDALGPAEKFNGRIVKIDPAETIVSGVIYYKITSVFDAADDRIKSGMTVNLDIQTDKKEDVLYLPYYTVKEKNGAKYVQILLNGKIAEKIIKTGLEGETMIEIVEGLAEGDQVAVTQ